MSFSKILVPTDCSAASAHAIERAVAIAAAFGAEVVVLHVAPLPGDYYPLDKWLFGKDAEAPRLEGRARAAATTSLERFIDELPEAVQKGLQTRLELGVARDMIVEVAAEGFDLIVMASKGLTGAKRVLLGSVAERVVRTAPCAVLTLRDT